MYIVIRSYSSDDMDTEVSDLYTNRLSARIAFKEMFDADFKKYKGKNPYVGTGYGQFSYEIDGERYLACYDTKEVGLA